jgi:hypothetical protein
VAAPESRPGPPPVLWAAVFGAGVALRLLLFSGYGLGDDPNYFIAFNMIEKAGTYYPSDPYQMRFGIWVPVVIAMKLFGQTELGFVGGMLLCSIFNLALVYLLARQEWEWPYALLAMALLAVCPLDVLCSTLFANDMMLGTWCFTAFFLYRKAILETTRPAVRRASAVASGLFLLFGFVTKPWVSLMLPIFAAEASWHWRAWRVTVVTGLSTAVFVGSYVAWQQFRFGDPLYHINVAKPLAIFMPYSRDLMLDYPRMLFLPNQYGARFAGFYPHLVLGLGALFVLRSPAAAKWLLYLAVLLLGLTALPAGRRDGQWVTLVPHIFRYLAFVSIPLCLALAAWLREACRWRPALGVVVIVVILGVSVAQSVAVTEPTRDAFGEQRRAIAVLRQFPDEPVVSDDHFLARIAHFEWKDRRGERAVPLRREGARRAVEYAAVTESMVVTGGGRLPWYGCPTCNSNLGAFDPPRTWTLVAAFEDRPITGYRLEPLRVWRVSEASGRVQEMLAERPDAGSRRKLLRRLATREDRAAAVELGKALLATSPDDAEVAYLTGAACARSRKLACATELLDRALRRGLRPTDARQALVMLVSARIQNFDFTGAHRAAAELRKVAPDYRGAELAELDSGMSEAHARFNEGRLPAAFRLFAAVAAREQTPADMRRRAFYYSALSLFSMRRVSAGVRWARAYRARYGDDAGWIELRYREGEAQRITNPPGAREAFADLVARYPNTYWGKEAATQLEAQRKMAR